MTDDKTPEDLPTIVASVMAMVPPLVFRTGVAYLKMKKRAQKMAKKIETELVSSGMPPKYAERLAEQYASDLSIRRMLRSMDIPFGSMRR